jgi:hypothetical protein
VAAEVRQFTATVPAGTPASAPVTVPIAFPVRVVRSIDWRVPNGPMGTFGWQLAMGGVQVLPTAGDTWVLANDEHGTWTPADAPDSGAWTVVGYNTGRYNHAVYLTFHLDLPAPRRPEVQLVPAALLGMAPDLAAVLRPGRRPP